MKFTQEELDIFVRFLDSIGSTSFVAGFKDGVHDYRNWLAGEKRPLDTDNGLVATFCYRVGFDAAQECIKTWLAGFADKQESLACMRRVVERLDAFFQEDADALEVEAERAFLHYAR